MAKKTWDKVIAAAPTIDNHLTQDDWHKLNRTSAPPPPPDQGGVFEQRVYNPSGPFYDTTVPPKATVKKETK